MPTSGVAIIITKKSGTSIIIGYLIVWHIGGEVCKIAYSFILMQFWIVLSTYNNIPGASIGNFTITIIENNCIATIHSLLKSYKVIWSTCKTEIYNI